MTLTIGPIVTAVLGRAGIGVHTSAALDAAAIGGRPMDTGIGTIILWTGRRVLFPTSNFRMHQSNKFRRRRQEPNSLRRCRRLPRRARMRSAGQSGALFSAAYSAAC
jgi:hypothetical protein